MPVFPASRCAAAASRVTDVSVPLVLPVLPCLRHLTAACGFRRDGAFFRRTMKEKWDGCSF